MDKDLNIGNFQLMFGDCLERMKQIPDNSIDCIVTDPPYKITSKGSAGTMGGFIINDKSKKGDIFSHNNINCSDYIPILYNKLKDKSLCYIMCNNINLQKFINTGTECGFNFVKCLIWNKGNKICGRYYMGCFEYIILFRKGGDRPINFCGTPDILNIPIKKLKDKNGKNLHDTEKPVKLMSILIENSTNIGDSVLEPFMGIGSTGVACVNTNRKFIGIELDEKYFDISCKRITDAINEKKQSLF